MARTPLEVRGAVLGEMNPRSQSGHTRQRDGNPLLSSGLSAGAGDGRSPPPPAPVPEAVPGFFDAGPEPWEGASLSFVSFMGQYSRFSCRSWEYPGEGSGHLAPPPSLRGYGPMRRRSHGS